MPTVALILLVLACGAVLAQVAAAHRCRRWSRAPSPPRVASRRVAIVLPA
jgi:hypothetical protein